MKIDTIAELPGPNETCTMSRHGCCVKDDDLGDVLDVDSSIPTDNVVLVGKDDPQMFGSA